jgi:ABC-type Fe3+-hydroxamate transport system substrate-binding protein
MPARTRRRAFALLASLLWLLAWASAGTAQPRENEKVNLVVTGEVTALDAAARKITVKSTNDEGVVYGVDASATILSGSQTLALGDLRVGWSVAMNGHGTGEDRLVTYIKVVKKP